MRKRKSRKELIEKIKTLKQQVLAAEYDARVANQEVQDLKTRMAVIGATEVKTIDGVPFLEFSLTPKPFGTYLCCCNPGYLTDQSIVDIKNKLTENLVNGLLSSGMLQFIVRDGDCCDPLSMPVVGVKLYAVPWEQVSLYRKQKLRYEPKQEAEEEYDPEDVIETERSTPDELTTGGESGGETNRRTRIFRRVSRE